MPETKITEDVAQAADALRRGLIVAFPTETVYGLGVDATNQSAVQRLFEAKGRPADNPLIVHLSSISQWPLAAAQMSGSAEQLLQAFSPGPITVVVEKAAAISPLVTAGLNTVGLRIPGHAQARQLLQLCNLPIAAPSANRSGRPSCTTWQSVLEDMDGRIDYVLCGDICEVGLESTVVECTGEHPVVLRAGQITLQQIQTVIPSATSFAKQAGPPTMPLASPGVRHPHYQPQAAVKLFDSIQQLASLTLDQRRCSAVVLYSQGNYDSISSPSIEGFALSKHYNKLEQYGREFYELLRHIDRCGLAAVYLQLVDESEQSAALRDRQLRSAGHLINHSLGHSPSHSPGPLS